jgi:hypothetical protein
MFDFTSFSDQPSEPDEEEVRKVLEAVKIALIKHFSLRSKQQDSTRLISATLFGNDEYLIIYVRARAYMHETGIAAVQNLLPLQFANLIQDDLKRWIPAPHMQRPP